MKAYNVRFSLGFVYYYYACIIIIVCRIIIILILATKACATYLNHHTNWVRYYFSKQSNIRVLPDRRTMSEKDLAMSPSHMWHKHLTSQTTQRWFFFCRKQCVLKNFFIRNYLCIKINMLHIPHMSYFTNTLIQALFLTIFSLLGWKANISNREHTLSCHLSRST